MLGGYVVDKVAVSAAQIKDTCISRCKLVKKLSDCSPNYAASGVESESGFIIRLGIIHVDAMDGLIECKVLVAAFSRGIKSVKETIQRIS
jgi:hypothetical protein